MEAAKLSSRSSGRIVLGIDMEMGNRSGHDEGAAYAAQVKGKQWRTRQYCGFSPPAIAVYASRDYAK